MKPHIEYRACSQERADKKQCCYCEDHEHCGFVWSSTYTSVATEESIKKALEEYQKKRLRFWVCILLIITGILFIILR